jgi:hypothetical protein
MTRRQPKATPPVAALSVPGVRILVADADAMAVGPATAAALPATAGANAPFRKLRPRFVF